MEEHLIRDTTAQYGNWILRWPLFPLLMMIFLCMGTVLCLFTLQGIVGHRVFGSVGGGIYVEIWVIDYFSKSSGLF